jgi:hypothetical protein
VAFILISMATREFSAFLKEHVRPVLKARGYKASGQTYTMTAGPATAHLVFMRYTVRQGCFDMRMTIGLDAAHELGAVVHGDLSIIRYGAIAAAPWRWPCPADRWPGLAHMLIPDVIAGAAWIETLLDLRRLAEHLEGQRRFTEAGDAEVALVMDRLQHAGAEVLYESSGFREPKAGRLRPAKVRALSHVYELLEDWPAALAAWDDYMHALPRLRDATDPETQKAVERRAFLAARRDG